MLNIEKYKEEILELAKKELNYAVTKTGKIVSCFDNDCDKCMFHKQNISNKCDVAKIIWNLQEYKEKITLTRFEYDLLEAFPNHNKFNYFKPLKSMKLRGYFKSIKDENMTIKEIMNNCEVVQDD